MPTTDRRIERLGLHIALTTNLLQGGTPMFILKRELVILRGVIEDVLNADDISGDEEVALVQLMSDEMARRLAGDVEVPDDISDL